jgi:hypothetical protein
LSSGQPAGGLGQLQRAAEQVAGGGEELELGLRGLGVGAGGALVLVQPGVVDRDRGLRGGDHDEPLVRVGEAADLVVAEEQAAVHDPRPGHDRDGEVRAHRQVPLGHAEVGRVLPEPRVGRDVVEPHRRRPRERRREDRRVARQPEPVERLHRRARQREQQERLAVRVHRVVEERAEVRAAQRRREVGEDLHDRPQVELAGQRRADLAQRLDVPAFVGEVQLGVAAFGDVVGRADPLVHRAVVVAYRDGPRDDGPPGAVAGEDGVLHLVRLAARDRLGPARRDPLPVVGVDRVQPARAQHLVAALAGTPAPRRHVRREPALGVGTPDVHGDRLDQRPVPRLAGPQRLLCRFGDRRGPFGSRSGRLGGQRGPLGGRRGRLGIGRALGSVPARVRKRARRRLLRGLLREVLRGVRGGVQGRLWRGLCSG